MKGKRINILMMHLVYGLLARKYVGTQMLAIVSLTRTCHNTKENILKFRYLVPPQHSICEDTQVTQLQYYSLRSCCADPGNHFPYTRLFGKLH